MRRQVMLGLMVGVAIISATEIAQAACTGTPAPTDALNAFMADPAAWLAGEGNKPLASDIQSLAVAASANPDLSAPSGEHYAKFQGALKSLLAPSPDKPNSGASPTQSKTIGTALGTLALTCGKAGAEETAFVTAVQQGIAQSGNQVADNSYGDALKETQTASTGSGASTGVGGGTNGTPTGGSNTGPNPPGNFGTNTGPESNPSNNGAGSSGTLSGTGTNGTNGTGTTTTNIVNNGLVATTNQ